MGSTQGQFWRSGFILITYPYYMKVIAAHNVNPAETSSPTPSVIGHGEGSKSTETQLISRTTVIATGHICNGPRLFNLRLRLSCIFSILALRQLNHCSLRSNLVQNGQKNMPLSPLEWV
jgi:hypothetical protein